ncbi:hypothetical protein ACK9YZ_05375 [Rhizobium sp. ZK1]|uniref:hypothetical protein n=1 Tax=Rhizobium sp. ZK1 TaxID=3389872 RepID=UPI0039F6B88C
MTLNLTVIVAAQGEFLGSLQPACPDVFDKVPRSHKQNYWIRYKVPPLRTPHGLWVYPHRRAYDGTSVIETSEERILDWWCASAVAMSAEYDNRPHRDHERVFLHEADPDAWAIVSSIPLDSPASFAFPPVLEKQQIRYHEIWDIDACQIFAAAVDPEFGGWDLRWEMDGIGHSLWTSASRLWSRSSVEEFARQLV